MLDSAVVLSEMAFEYSSNMSDIQGFKAVQAWSSMHDMHLLPPKSSQEIKLWMSSSALPISLSSKL